MRVLRGEMWRRLRASDDVCRCRGSLAPFGAVTESVVTKTHPYSHTECTASKGWCAGMESHMDGSIRSQPCREVHHCHHLATRSPSRVRRAGPISCPNLVCHSQTQCAVCGHRGFSVLLTRCVGRFRKHCEQKSLLGLRFPCVDVARLPFSLAEHAMR